MSMTNDEAKDFFGADAAEWLKRWDDGQGVWSIETGGLGPGYEQCIQITAAELLRFILGKAYDVAGLEGDTKAWEKISDECRKAMFEVPAISDLGLSGAQYGAAYNLAWQLYRRGPAVCFMDEEVQDRKIQVRKRFPQAPQVA